MMEDNILLTMKKHYKYGYRFASPIEFVRFCNNYKNDHNLVLDISIEELGKVLNQNCIYLSGKYYIVSEKTRFFLQQIIGELNSSGQKIFYYDELFCYVEKEVYEILSVEMLEEYMRKLFPYLNYKKNYCYLGDENYSENILLKNELRRVWGDFTLRSVQEILRLIKYVPEEKIKYSLSQNYDFIWNSLESYALIDKFLISEDEVEEIKKIANKECNIKGYFNLYDLSIDNIKERNYEMSDFAIFECIMKTVLVDYGRNDKVVRRKNECRSQNDFLINYVKNKSICTLNELIEYQNDITGTVRIDVIVDAISNIMIRTSEQVFMSKNSVNFDKTIIDSILDDYYSDYSIGMKEIVSFIAFPDCGVSWNHFVLESYLKNYSEKYTYITNNTNSGNAGAIIKRNNKMNYFDILCDAVQKSKCKREKNDILNELVIKGYLLKKYYKKIDLLLEKVK